MYHVGVYPMISYATHIYVIAIQGLTDSRLLRLLSFVLSFFTF